MRRVMVQIDFEQLHRFSTRFTSDFDGFAKHLQIKDNRTANKRQRQCGGHYSGAAWGMMVERVREEDSEGGRGRQEGGRESARGSSAIGRQTGGRESADKERAGSKQEEG